MPSASFQPPPSRTLAAALPGPGASPQAGPPPGVSTYSDRASLRRRAPALALAAIANLLLILMLLGMTPSVLRAPKPAEPLTVQLLPEPSAGAKSPRAPAKARKPAGGGAPHPAESLAPPPPPIPVPPPPLQMMILSHDDFAASDISKLPTRKPGAGPQGPALASAGADGGAAQGNGDGPHGETLYNADWYTKPTNAELDTYLPRNAPRTGWGMVACRTIDNYRVDDCAEIGDSPAGSGFARAVRQAAWQFRVRPPRIGGKSMVGAWVRIRIDYTEGGVAAR